MTTVTGWMCVWMAALAAPASGPANLPASRPATRPTTPASAADAATINRLVERLGNPVYAERFAARESLVSFGPAAYPLLKQSFRTARTYDVRRQIRQIVQRIYIEEQMGPPTAFLGIQYAAQEALPNPQVPVKGAIVHVNDVIFGTAADAAGIHPHDLIIGLNGAPIQRGEAQQPMFGGWIAQQPPGTQCELTIARGKQVLTLTVTLGRRPWHLSDALRFGTSDRLQTRLGAFSGWWRREFDPRGLVGAEVTSDRDPYWRMQDGATEIR